MMTQIGVTGCSLLLFAVTLAAPGYAVAQSSEPLVPPVPNAGACHAGAGPCAVLYETTENMRLRGLRGSPAASAEDSGGRRTAVSALLGFAVRGTPLCPEELMPVIDPLPAYCAVNVTGSDNISLKTGLGQFRGSVTVVVQEVNPVTNISTPDSPEVVIARGRFTGDMDFSSAIVDQVPLGSVVGRLSLDGFGRPAPFTGVFRLPFRNALLAAALHCDLTGALYLTDPDNFGVPPTFGASCVGANETAIGYPTVRFEISFPDSAP